MTPEEKEAHRREVNRARQERYRRRQGAKPKGSEPLSDHPAAVRSRKLRDPEKYGTMSEEDRRRWSEYVQSRQ